MFTYKACSYTASLIIIVIILTSFSSLPLSLVVYRYPTDVYASNISCDQITDSMTCKNQLNLQTSSDTNDLVLNNNDDSSAPNSEKDRIPLLIPDISPTITDDTDDNSDDESSGQDDSENGGEGSSRDSNNDGDDGDDLEATVPSLLPFP